MSVNLSIGLCCVTSVIVCKCCGLSVAMPIANSPTPSLQRNYLNHYTNTQYQPNIVIHDSGIYLVENYFLRSAPLFSFSNSRSAKSKTWMRAVALLQTWHLNAMKQHRNAMRMTYIQTYIYIYTCINMWNIATNTIMKWIKWTTRTSTDIWLPWHVCIYMCKFTYIYIYFAYIYNMHK